MVLETSAAPMVDVDIVKKNSPGVQSASISNFDSRSQSSLDLLAVSRNPTPLHTSLSHTNLLLVDSGSDSAIEDAILGDDSVRRKSKRMNLAVSLDPALVCLLSQIPSGDAHATDGLLQAVKTVLDGYCSKYTGEWDTILGENAKSLFHSLGGWKSLILKLHQMFADILLPVETSLSSSTFSNMWETSSLCAHLSRIQVNPDRVQEALARVTELEHLIPMIAVKLQQSAYPDTLATSVCLIDLQILWYAVQCCGRFDVYLQAMLADQLDRASGTLHAAGLGKRWDFAHALALKGNEIYEAAQFRCRLFSEQYDWYLLMLSQQGSAEGIEATLRDIETDLQFANFNPCDESARKRIERLLVQMLGHECEKIRSMAVVLLNRFYDTHDWQRDAPFEDVCVVTQGSALKIDFPHWLWSSAGESPNVCVELVAPSMSPEPHHREPLTRHYIQPSAQWAEFGPSIFRSGFYDWRVLSLSSAGSWKPVRSPSTNAVLMGRIVVQPRAAQTMHLCSLTVDQVEGGGTFSAVTNVLPDLAEVGISAVHLQGVPARDSGQIELDLSRASLAWAERPTASLDAVTDRASPCEFLGGREAFLELTCAARARGMSTLVDMHASVSSTRKHRKYKDQQLFSVDESGVKRLMYASGSQTCMLNYRLVEAWDLLTAEVMEWPSQFGVSGCFLKDGAQWPPLHPVDLGEMLRVDPDGQHHYSSAEVMAGTVVVGSPASLVHTDVAGYANPLHVKLVREIWREFPNFVVMVESSVGEAKKLVLSGIVPVLTQLSLCVGAVTAGKSSVGVVTDWLVQAKSQLPKGAVVGLASVPGASSVLPAGLFGRARAAYTDLLLSLPFIPCLQYGEYLGRDSTGNHTAGAAVEEVAVEGGDVVDVMEPSVHVLHESTPLLSRRRNPSLSALLNEQAGAVGVEVGLTGGMATELEPVTCLGQYTNWLRDIRRKRIFASFVSASPDSFKLVPSGDPLVLAFICVDVGAVMIGCVNFGASDTVVNVGIDGGFTQGAEDAFLIESELGKHATTKGLHTLWALSELAATKVKLVVPQFGSVFRLFRATTKRSQGMEAELLCASFRRSGSFARGRIQKAVRDNACSSLHALLHTLVNGGNGSAVLSQLVSVGSLGEEDGPMLIAKMRALASGGDDVATQVLAEWEMGPILFTTPELGKWSTFGGLGVMVDDLVNTMSPILRSPANTPTVWVCSPYYERNRKGESGYLAKDGIGWSFNMVVDIGVEHVTVGVYEGVLNGVRHFFFHNGKYFPSIYPDQPAVQTVQFLALMAKCPLELCCKLGVFPSTIVTNDWATGLTAAYAKRGFFGSVFSKSKFMHIVHNLDQNYEGRVFPLRTDDVGRIHMLPHDLLVDPHWQRFCVNPSRCAILCSDNWGTVSVSYRKELMEGSALAPILRMHPSPFAHPNGIPLDQRLARIKATGCETHWDAKRALQRKYFNRNELNNPASDKTVLLAFVGRITFQKGVHLILDIAEHLLKRHAGSVQILVGGATNPGEQYAQHCAGRMRDLSRRFPNSFWSDPDSFFTDGPLVNLGADFGLMPSAFEPGGIVQQEFMVAGTPVIAFKTGGLRDTISEFYNGVGNGFTFEAHTGGDLAYAIERALRLFWSDDVTHGYELLRKNARASVVTCDMVATAWLKEFYRMHARLFVNEQDVALAMRAIEPWVETASGKDLSLKLEDGGGFDSDESSDESTVEGLGSTSAVSSPVSTMSMSSRTLSRDSSATGLFRRSVRVSYKPKPSVDLPRSVLLAGSFDQWGSRIPLKWNRHTRVFHVDIRVPQGKWYIKLIVDGLWTCVDEYPTERDFAGNTNNVILVD